MPNPDDIDTIDLTDLAIVARPLPPVIDTIRTVFPNLPDDDPFAAVFAESVVAIELSPLTRDELYRLFRAFADRHRPD